MPAYDTRPTSDNDVAACLAELPPLSIPHWSWPFDSRLYSQPALLEQVIRILGAGAITANLWQYRNPADWESLLRKLVVRMKAAGVYDLCLNYGVWGGFGGDPSLVENTTEALDWLTAFRNDLTRVRDAIAAEAAWQTWPLRVRAVWIDQEAFKRGATPEWNTGLAWINNQTLAVAHEVFGRDGVHYVQHGRGISSYYNADDERTGNHSCPLYTLDDVDGSLERYRQAVRLAAAEGVSGCYPILAFGGRYKWEFHKQVGWRPDAWRANHAWRWGSWINDVYFRAKQPEIQGYAHRVLLWPRCMPSVVGNAPVPAYGEHLVAYVCGAARKYPLWIAE